MVKISTWEYFKKRWLYFLSFAFLYTIPGIMIISKMVKIENANKSVSVSITGLIIGIVYLAFVAKKLKQKIHDMKPSALKIIVSYISSILPLLTVGFLIVLVKNALVGFDYTVWAICAFIMFGAFIQAIEFLINKKFLYNIEIEKKAREKIDIEKKMVELRKEIEDE